MVIATDARQKQTMNCSVVRDAVGPTDLMEFIRFDQGEVLRKELGKNAPRVMRLLVGNPLTMRKMVKFVHDADS